MPMNDRAVAGWEVVSDLGHNNGHSGRCAGHQRADAAGNYGGPLFMSIRSVSNVQYRLSEADGGTRILFRHSALGLIEEDHRKGVTKGWRAYP